MSSGLYTHRTRNAGEIVTDTLYNTAHKNQQINDVPNEAGAHSDTLTQFRATQDPAPGGVVNQVIDLANELEQLRFTLADIKTALQSGTPPTFWYSPLTFAAATVIGKGARVYRNTTQGPISSNACVFNTVRYDTGVTDPGIDPFFSLSSPTRLTARAAGLYQINGFVQWDVGAGVGDIEVFILYNNTRNLAGSRWTTDSVQSPWLAVSTQFLMAQGDFVELLVKTTVSGLHVINPEFGLEFLSPTAVVPPPTQRTLMVSEIGTGSGTVTSNVGGINCPGVCSASYADGSTVILTATPTVGGFVTWSGDVPIGHETDNPLTLTMDQARSVAATFTAYTLTITEAGSGSGIVTSNVGGINCPGTCSAQYAPGTVVQLTATPTAGGFVAWSGDLVSSSNPDSITMNADKNVVATFALIGAIPSIGAGGSFTGTRFGVPSTILQLATTLGNAQFTAPFDMTITELKVTLTAALAAAHTLTAQFNVNGSDSAAIVVSMTTGDQAKRATGTLAIIAGDLISMKFVQSGGSGDSILGTTVIYKPS